MLECEFKWLVMFNVDFIGMFVQFYLKMYDELLIVLVLGEVNLGQILCLLQEVVQLLVLFEIVFVLLVLCLLVIDQSVLSIEGVGNLLIVFVCCCQLLLGDLVCGFVMCGCGVLVYWVDCVVLVCLVWCDLDWVIDVSWGCVVVQVYQVDIELYGYDCKGLQKDVMVVISNVNILIIVLFSCMFVCIGEVEMCFMLCVCDYEQFLYLFVKLVVLFNVVDVWCVGSC